RVAALELLGADAGQALRAVRFDQRRVCVDPGDGEAPRNERAQQAAAPAAHVEDARFGPGAAGDEPEDARQLEVVSDQAHVCALEQAHRAVAAKFARIFRPTAALFSGWN